MSTKLENTTDATRGQPLWARVLARKDELEDALAELGPHDARRAQSIETALATVYLLMTGDLAHPSEVVARDLNRWLERNKHLGRKSRAASRLRGWPRRSRRPRSAPQCATPGTASPIEFAATEQMLAALVGGGDG